MIEISLCRVSSDSKYLDLMFNIPVDYTFTAMHIRARYIEDNEFVTKEFDVSEQFINLNKKEYVVRIELAQFGISVPAIYEVQFVAQKYILEPEAHMALLTDTAYCSDVNLVYQSMLDDILSMGNKCTTISDEAIRKYLILYGHQSALYANDHDTAEMLFKILVKQFSNCGNNTRPGNCGYQVNSNYLKSNCGCKR